MSKSSNPYQERQLDSISLLDLISESMFKMSFLMRHITLALEQNKTEDVCLLSEKGLALLSVLENILHENEFSEEILGEFLLFCETMETCLQKVSLDTKGELSREMGASFKRIGLQFQKKQQELDQQPRKDP